MYIYLVVIRRVIGFKQLIFDEKKGAISKTLFKLMIWELDMNVLNGTMFCV